MKRTIIAITGMPGSGKSTVSEIVSKLLGCPLVSMGDVVREEVKKRGLPLIPEAIEKVAQDLRKEKGPNAVALLTLDKIINFFNNKYLCVIVDGVRSLDEIEVFSKHANVCIIAVHASPAVRLERLLSRGREGDISSLQEFKMRDRANLKLGLGNVIALADFMIINEGDLGDLENMAKKLIEKGKRNAWRSCGRGRD